MSEEQADQSRRIYFVPQVLRHWDSYEVRSSRLSTWIGTRSVTGVPVESADGSIGFLPVFDDLAKLREEFGDVAYTIIKEASRG